MKKLISLSILTMLAVALVACESRTDRTDGGGVLLSVTDFDGLPLRVGVNSAGGILQVDEFVIENVAKELNGVTSSLMNVELRSYEVTYTRADTGTRLPPPYVKGLFGVVPVNGTATYENLDVMGADQFLNEPLSDLAFSNGGFDKETGSRVIRLNLSVRFFGRTLSGDAVQTAPSQFTVEFIP
jgi:hypothetical protein